MNEVQLTESVSARLKSMLPVVMQKSVIPFPGKPESITGDIIKVQHPKGLFSVRYLESESAGVSEHIMTGVYIWATSPEMESRLARAAKIAINNHSPGGCSPLLLLKDESVIQENGVLVRLVTFRCQVPTIRILDPVAQIAALNL